VFVIGLFSFASRLVGLVGGWTRRLFPELGVLLVGKTEELAERSGGLLVEVPISAEVGFHNIGHRIEFSMCDTVAFGWLLNIKNLVKRDM
jgi:hypothetical protein